MERTLSFVTQREEEITSVDPPCVEKFSCGTLMVIKRTKDLIDKIYCLLEVSLLLKADEMRETKNSPTIHEILTNDSARQHIQNRILNEISNDNPLLQKLTRSFPDLLNESDQVFNQWILRPIQCGRLPIDTLVPALKSSRIPVIKD